MGKPIAVGVMACLLALALAGCGGESDGAREKDPNRQTSALLSETQDVLATSDAVQARQADQGLIIDWVSVKTAEDAAHGAGFGEFGVMDAIVIDDVEYTNPAFSYAGGVAQALYEKGAIAIIVRKADGRHIAPLTDRNKDDFAAQWVKTMEDVEVTLYGPAKGAVVVADWNDGNEDFTITYQGLGGEEVTMDSDDVAAIVKGFKGANTEAPRPEQGGQANAGQPAESSNAAGSGSDASQAASDAGSSAAGDADSGNASGDAGSGTDSGSNLDLDDAPSVDENGNPLPISAEQAASMAVQTMGGTAANVQLVNSDLYGTCWFVTLDGDDTVPAGCYVNMYGAMFATRTADDPDEEGRISMDQAATLAAQSFGGYAQSIVLTETDDYGTVWDVHVQNDNGDTGEYYVTMDGAAYPVGK